MHLQTPSSSLFILIIKHVVDIEIIFSRIKTLLSFRAAAFCSTGGAEKHQNDYLNVTFAITVEDF